MAEKQYNNNSLDCVNVNGGKKGDFAPFTPCNKPFLDSFGFFFFCVCVKRMAHIFYQKN